MTIFALKSWNSPAPILITFFDDKPFRREQTTYLSIILAVELLCFKFCYPFPDFFGDSYNYIAAALYHMDINIWPIGYSKFLDLFHWVSNSPTSLIVVQYFLLEAAYFYLYQTIIRFCPTSRRIRIIMLFFFFLNPINLYISNYVSSDGLFLALSLVWLTEVLWIIYKPVYYHIIALSVVFFIAFTFRYNAMIYPLISSFAFLLSKQSTIKKLLGILLGPLLILPFILYSSNAAKILSGTPQFPPIYGGWQWANNALYIREYIQEDSNAFPTPQTAQLDQLARNFFRSVPPAHRDLAPYVGNYFIQQPDAPLKQYKERYYAQLPTVEAWAKVAPVFKTYGLWLIKRHPFAFARYYLLMNSKNYFLPPLEKLEIYNLNRTDIDQLAVIWFGLYGSRVSSAFPRAFQGNFLFFYPYLFLFLNFYFCWSFYFFVKQKGRHSSPRSFPITVALITILLLTNFGFSVFANIIAFRYQLFPMTVLLIFSLIMDTNEQLQQKPVSSE